MEGGKKGDKNCKRGDTLFPPPKRSVYEISVKTDPETLGQNETDPRQSLKGIYIAINTHDWCYREGPGSRFVILSKRLNFNMI